MSFRLPEENEAYNDAKNGTKSAIIIEQTWQKLFRPYLKHGYNDEELNKLLQSKNGKLIIEKLMDIYQGVLNENQD